MVTLQSNKFFKKQLKKNKNRASNIDKQILITVGVATSPRKLFNDNAFVLGLILIVQELQRLYFVFQPKVSKN